MCVWWGFGKKLKKKRPKRVKHLRQQYTTMKPKVHIQQVFIITAAIFGIGLLWINFNEKVFKTVHHLVSVQFTWSEEKHPTWKGPVSERRRICELMGINWQKEKGTYVRLAAKTAVFFCFEIKKNTGYTLTRFDNKPLVGAKPPPKCFTISWVFHIISHYFKSIDSIYTKLGE